MYMDNVRLILVDNVLWLVSGHVSHGKLSADLSNIIGSVDLFSSYSFQCYKRQLLECMAFAVVKLLVLYREAHPELSLHFLSQSPYSSKDRDHLSLSRYQIAECFQDASLSSRLAAAKEESIDLSVIISA